MNLSHIYGNLEENLYSPDNKDDMEYMYRRGFEDAFIIEPDLPFKSFL